MVPNGEPIKIRRGFRASRMYNPEIQSQQWDPYIVSSVTPKDTEAAKMSEQDVKRRFIHHYVSAVKYLKKCETNTGEILPTASVIDESIPKDRLGKHPTVRLMLTTLFVDGVAADASPITMKFPEGYSSMCGLAMSKEGFNKRFLNTHINHAFLNALPLTHRILLGPDQKDELCYYLEKRPSEDIFKVYPYPEDLVENPPRDFSLISRAKQLGKYDLLGNMLAYSDNPKVIDELLEAPRESDCLTHFLEETCRCFDLKLETVFKSQDLTQLINHLTTALGVDEKDYGSIEDIASDFYENPRLQDAIKIIVQQGPISEDNIETYLHAIETSTTSSTFDKHAVQQALSELMEYTSIANRL